VLNALHDVALFFGERDLQEQNANRVFWAAGVETDRGKKWSMPKKGHGEEGK